VVRYYALLGDTGIIGGRDHRKNCPCVPYWLNSSQPQIQTVSVRVSCVTPLAPRTLKILGVFLFLKRFASEQNFYSYINKKSRVKTLL